MSGRKSRVNGSLKLGVCVAGGGCRVYGGVQRFVAARRRVTIYQVVPHQLSCLGLSSYTRHKRGSRNRAEDSEGLADAVILQSWDGGPIWDRADAATLGVVLRGHVIGEFDELLILEFAEVLFSGVADFGDVGVHVRRECLISQRCRKRK